MLFEMPLIYVFSRFFTTERQLKQIKHIALSFVKNLSLEKCDFKALIIQKNVQAYYDSVQKEQQVEEIFHSRLLEVYNNYLIIGGMPECVVSWVKYKDPSKISQIQRELIKVYENDFSKHMAGIDNSAILLKTDYQFKGPLTENYVLQQLHGQFEIGPRYYSDKNTEIDFVLQYGTEVIPIEAKGSEDKSAPSFKRYISVNEPEHALRFSKRGYRKDGYITNLPLYLARKTKELL